MKRETSILSLNSLLGFRAAMRLKRPFINQEPMVTKSCIAALEIEWRDFHSGARSEIHRFHPA